ncbi:hypothetical protein B9S53_06155 [Arthrospira sp. O9.13F]|uniref:Sulfatase-modifying factor enzyme domain-containing protein n=1 Tax=Limnospira indica PCC 8005 TaxID=376219 RepID=A0A9P1KIJ1_9CYAN|nr:hypothetical protein [Limnospira indica]RAQ44200.1 hypothetical protein B9S53_09690 [Arthrospira sp. O9.13F]RAQ46709.1 hypothetical protein B9S53_06155 [Arthrospira sp. O9.13F]CDM96996.1 hypothetical protein ARTHRO_41405 [Limnospira indica PCC 8005]
MLRGGSWNNNPENCRCAYRNRNDPDNLNNNNGFRVACAPPRLFRARADGWEFVGCAVEESSLIPEMSATASENQTESGSLVG